MRPQQMGCKVQMDTLKNEKLFFAVQGVLLVSTAIFIT